MPNIISMSLNILSLLVQPIYVILFLYDIVSPVTYRYHLHALTNINLKAVFNQVFFESMQ